MPDELADRRRRYADLDVTLDEWSKEESDFDKVVGPLIDSALRESAPRHFDDEQHQTAQQRIDNLREWCASHEPLPYEADDSRESIYEDCGL